MKAKKILKITLIVGLTIAILILSFVLWFVLTAINEVKTINVSLSDNVISSCQIYDSKNNSILNNDSINNTYVELSDINPITIEAFLSIEDKAFYEHDGLNYPRMVKAVLTNIIDGKYSEGASTISQQLIKNKYLSNEKTMTRKIKEIYLTKKLEAVEDKDVILENYLNTIYYGNGAYGIGNASYRFFGKLPNELTLSESCILAGAVNYPALYSPINNLEKCIARRNIVLGEMLEDNKISKEEYDNAVSEEVKLNVQSITNISTLDLYSRNVLREASEILGISEQEILNRNYKIHTYQDSNIQNTLDMVIRDDRFYDKNEYGNIADSLSIILDNQTGGVCAVSGRSEYDLLDFKRQPGSLVKPVIVYTPALEEKIIYQCSEILDEKISFGKYSPHNVGDVYYGYTSINDCVAKSLNIPAVKLCEKLGVDTCKYYGEKCGLRFDKNDTGLAVSLGGLTNGFTLQNITESYLPFSNGGMYKKSKYISKIISPHNLTIYTNKMTESKYCNEDNAYLMTETLRYSTKYGTSKKLANCTYDIAGKTGTVNVKNSNLNTDAYSLAYTTRHTMSVWLGNYSMDGKFNLEGNNNGGTFATEIIKSTLDKIYEVDLPENFQIPDTIISAPIDTIELDNNHNVLLATNLPERYQKYKLFSKSNMPSESPNQLNKIDSIDFAISDNDNSIDIAVSCKEYLTYQIYRYSSNSPLQLVYTISNHSGEYIYNDTNVNFNEKYSYYIMCSSNYADVSIKSPTKFACITKNYNEIINEIDNSSWLFA